MPFPTLETPEEVAHYIQRLEEQKDTLTELYGEAIAALRKFHEISHLLNPSLIENMVFAITKELPFHCGLQEAAAVEPMMMMPRPATPFTGTIYERMVQFFLANNNRPASNSEIRTAIGSNRGTVAMVLYNTHSGDFVKSKRSGDHLIYWNMSDDAFERAISNTSKMRDDIEVTF